MSLEMRNEDPMTEFNLDRVASELNSLGIAAEVEHTGGGTATLFAGERFFDRNGDPRWMVIGGPGWFSAPTYLTGATADTSEFDVRDDNDTWRACDTWSGTELDRLSSTRLIERYIARMIAARVHHFPWPDGAYQRTDGDWSDPDVLADELRRRQSVAGQFPQVV